MSAVEWYYARDNKQMGPVPAIELKRLATAGEIGPDGAGDRAVPARSLLGVDGNAVGERTLRTRQRGVHGRNRLPQGAL